nr:unnamed protein product [Callosobruchus analis]
MRSAFYSQANLLQSSTNIQCRSKHLCSATAPAINSIPLYLGENRFDKHIDYMATKLSKHIFLLRTLSRIVPSEVVLLTFHVLYQSVASYAILVWGHAPQPGRVFALQRSVVRVIAGSGCRDDARQTFINLNIMTVLVVIYMNVFFIHPEILTDIIETIFNMNTTQGLQTKLKSTSLDNYRPISTLSILSKIIEKLEYTSRQHGFRLSFSTETGVIDLIQKIHNALDENKLATVIYFDLSRAFDTVNGNFFCGKLYNLRFRGPINKWIGFFLSERKITVMILK